MRYFCRLFQQNVSLKAKKMGIYQSGQMGQTVNLLVNAYGGSNPSVPTFFYYLESFLQEDSASGSSSFGRAIAFQAIGGGFEPRLPLE